MFVLFCFSFIDPGGADVSGEIKGSTTAAQVSETILWGKKDCFTSSILCTQRLLLLVLTLLHKASSYFTCHGSATVIARVTMLTVLAFCSVQSENGRSHACMRLLAHVTGPELCRLLPLKNSSLHAKLGLFSDNRANFIVETDLMRVHFRHFRFVLLGLRIIFASGLSACSWTRF